MQNYREFLEVGLGIEITPIKTILLFLIVIWTFFWKGLALWHAVKREEKKWFFVILIVNTFGVLEIFYLFYIIKIKSVKLN